MFIPASDSSPVIRARTPFVLIARSDTVIDISLKFFVISFCLNGFVILSTSSVSSMSFTLSVPVEILRGGSFIEASFGKIVCGSPLIVMHDMLFFVETSASLNIDAKIRSSFRTSCIGNRLMLDITASRLASRW